MSSVTQTRLINELQHLINRNPGITQPALEHALNRVSPKEISTALTIGKSKELWNRFDGGYFPFAEVPNR